MAGCSLALTSRGAELLPIHKAVLFSMLPPQMSILDRFQLARDTGFEQTECGTTDDARQADEILAASKRTGVRIHSVMNRDHWKYPLSSRDPEVVAKSIDGLKTSLRNANLWGADTVLLVPAVVNAETSYQQAWDRSQVQIRKMIPLAEELKVIIAVEEVWKISTESAGICALRRLVSKPLGTRLFRRRQRGNLRLPSGLDSHPGQAYRQIASQGFYFPPGSEPKETRRRFCHAA
jgi:Xylose isomerase-like TIM barrel